jgi:hypothetical protein
MIIPKDEAIKELSKDYSPEEIDVIFAYHTDHPIIQDTNGTYRWEKFIDWETTPNMDPNTIFFEYLSGKMTQEEFMAYNRNIGYSLYGYWEKFVFNDRFNYEKYEEDMIEKKRQDRSNKLSTIIDKDGR